jgi:hypothetical protein
MATDQQRRLLDGCQCIAAVVTDSSSIGICGAGVGFSKFKVLSWQQLKACKLEAHSMAGCQNPMC